MKQVKKLLACMLVVILVLAVIGCAPQKVENQPAATGASAAGGETTAAAEGGASAEPVTISFWKWIPTEGLQTDSLVEAWNKQYPNIKLNITHVGESEAHFQKLSAALAAGEGPTILALQVGARANQYKEFCEPLKPLAEAKWGADWENKFLAAALEQCRYSGGDYTVLPGGMTATPVIQYNATAFKKLGITKAPETMDELRHVIEVSKSDPNIIPGIGIGAKEGWTCRDVFMGIVNQVAPGKVYDAQEGKASFKDPEFVESFKIWQDLFKSGIFAAGSLGVALYPDINDNFALAGTKGGKYYIMENCGTWHGSGLTKVAVEDGIKNGTRASDMNLGFFTLPPVKEGAKQNMVVTVDVAWGLNKAASDAEKKAGFEFVAWMAAGEGQTIWTNTLQVLPAAKGIDLSQAKGDMYGETEKQALEMAQKFVENNAGPREIRYAEIANAMNDALVAVAGGTMTPEKAAESLQTASESTTR